MRRTELMLIALTLSGAVVASYWSVIMGDSGFRLVPLACLVVACAARIFGVTMVIVLALVLTTRQLPGLQSVPASVATLAAFVLLLAAVVHSRFAPVGHDRATKAIAGRLITVSLIFLFATSFAIALSRGASLADTVASASPFALITAAALQVTSEQSQRLGRALAIVATAYSLAYSLTAVSGVQLLPLVDRMDPAAAFGLNWFRVYAPGGVLASYAAIWGAASLASRGHRGDRLTLLAFGFGTSASLLSFSRTVLASVALALIVVGMIAVRAQGGGGGRFRRLSPGALALLGGVLVNDRLQGSLTELQGTGNFGVRTELLNSYLAARRSGTARLEGFASPSINSVDSGLTAWLYRFGVTQTVILGLLLFGLGVALAWRLRGDAVRDGQHAPAAVGLGLVVFYAGMCFTTDVLIAPTPLLLLALTLKLGFASVDGGQSEDPRLENASTHPST